MMRLWEILGDGNVLDPSRMRLSRMWPVAEVERSKRMRDRLFADQSWTCRWNRRGREPRGGRVWDKFGRNFEPSLPALEPIRSIGREGIAS